MSQHVFGMTNTIAHRRPDDEGASVDPDAGIGLGNRRLAMIDLSPEGHQPMHSASGRYVITYNGEVFNAAAIAETLESEGLAPRWHGHSDTEVILAAIEAWGLDKALASFNGMFAFALWDARERTLCLVRDRLGVKPLYYGRFNGALVFGSELQTIAAYPGAELTIDRGWLDRYLREIHQRSEDTIYRGVRGLRPGTHVTFDQQSEGTSSRVLVGDRQGGGRTSQSLLGNRGRGRRAIGQLVERCGPLAHGQRRSAGGFAVGRDRFLDGPCASAAAELEEDPQLLHRISRLGPR